MAKKSYGPSVLTANDLLTGVIVYWDGRRWVEDIAHAVRAPAGSAESLAATGKEQEGENIVVGAYLVELGPDGLPVLLRERMRLAGPSVLVPELAERRAA